MGRFFFKQTGPLRLLKKTCLGKSLIMIIPMLLDPHVEGCTILELNSGRPLYPS